MLFNARWPERVRCTLVRGPRRTTIGRQWIGVIVYRVCVRFEYYYNNCQHHVPMFANIAHPVRTICDWIPAAPSFCDFQTTHSAGADGGVLDNDDDCKWNANYNMIGIIIDYEL